LTGLANRRALQPRLAAELSRHDRSGQALAVLLVDVDHLKRVNDHHGHAAGDEVLRSVAAVLAASCRRSDLVVRVGGEEFLLLLLPETGEGVPSRRPTSCAPRWRRDRGRRWGR
jgi:diguanylate cyclase (GGDEF)-like protein